jgi:membrane associated rhomboid family serine protease
MGRLTDGIKHLLIVNLLFFVGTSLYGDLFYSWFSLWYVQNPNFSAWQIVSHMFMHGGLMHLVFNMYALWAFGSPLERMWGTRKFLFFYFSAGLGAALIHTGVNYYHVQQGLDALTAAGVPLEEIIGLMDQGKRNLAWDQLVPGGVVNSMLSAYLTPAVGASGAIYGILVAFGMLFPNSELFLIFLPVPIKAKYFIPVLIGLDLFSGVTGYSIFGNGIAHFAHVGGALFGFIMMWYWKKNQFNSNRWDH